MYENIPQELQALNQWVVWRYEEKNGRQTKVPYQAANSQAHASTTDKSTWSDFQSSVATVQAGKAQGIGFVFSGSDPYTGIDLDHAVADNGKTQPWVEEMIDAFDSYAEYSPSGKGVHIIIKGEIPGKVGKKKSTIEVYSTGRYFTMTGNTINYKNVNERQQLLEDVVADYFEEVKDEAKSTAKNIKSQATLFNAMYGEEADDASTKQAILASKQAEEFVMLWKGIDSAYGNDTSVADMAFLCMLAYWLKKNPARMDQWYRMSRRYRDKWDEVHGDETYGAMTIRKAIETVAEVWTPNPTTVSTVKKDEFSIAIEPIDMPLAMVTHKANAVRLTKKLGEVMRFVPGDGWYCWDNVRWLHSNVYAKVKAGRLSHYIYEDMQKIMEQRNKTEDEAVRKDLDEKYKSLHKWMIASENASTINSSLQLAEGYLATDADVFDRHDYKLSVQNGTVDMTTGKLLPHEKSDLITKLAPVTYDPTAQCPLWEKFVSEIMGGDQELIDYVQKMVGYLISGDISQQCFFFFYGKGQNGKSTFLKILQRLLGSELAVPGAPDLLIASNLERHPTELADIRGARLVICSEIDKGKRLAVKRIKELTGESKVKARRMHQDFMVFDLHAKFVIMSNDKPEVNDDSYGMWRRIKLIPFVVTIPPEKRDETLEYKLATELSGILNWAIKGFMRYQKEGLKDVKAISQSVVEYREEQDNIIKFLREATEYKSGELSSRDEMYTAYSMWCDENEVEDSNRASRTALYKGVLNHGELHGVTDYKLQGYRHFKHITIVDKYKVTVSI